MQIDWINSLGAVIGPQIALNGDYSMSRAALDLGRPFTFGGSKTGAGAGVTVQLWGEVAGARFNIGDPQTIATGTPKAWPDEYTSNGKRGVTVSGLNETDDVLTLEIGQ